MLLKQVKNLMNNTSDQSSGGVSQTTSIGQWVLLVDQTKETMLGDIVEIKPALGLAEGHVIIAALDEENSTKANAPKLKSREQQFRRYQDERYRLLGAPFKEKLLKVRQREDDWDGKGSKKPNRNALDRAYIVLDTFLSAVIDSGRIWSTPFISSDEDGYITIEWKSGRHELHLEISQETQEYIKIWGINIEHEMHLDILKSAEYVSLWDWLNDD